MRMGIGAALGLGALAVGAKGSGCLAEAEPVLVIGHAQKGMWVEADCPGWEVTLEQRPVRYMGCILRSPGGPEPVAPPTLSTDDLDWSVFAVSTELSVEAYTVVRAEPGWGAGSCALRLLRSDPPLTARSPVILVEVDTQVESGRVPFVLPDTPDLLAGVGVTLEPSQPGVRVASILTGGPAAAEGVDVRDQILAVDDEPVDGSDPWSVVDLLVGEADTEVALTVASPGQAERLVRVSRRVIVDGPSTASWRQWRR